MRSSRSGPPPSPIVATSFQPPSKRSGDASNGSACRSIRAICCFWPDATGSRLSERRVARGRRKRTASTGSCSACWRASPSSTRTSARWALAGCSWRSLRVRSRARLMTRVGAVVLAAGQSSRFRAGGGRDPTKLVAELDGKPIVRRVVEAALAAKARPVVVVTGYARDSVEAAIAGLEIGVAFNPKFASGLASSLSVGLSVMPRDILGALVLLGDMPWIEPRLVDALIDAFISREGVLAAVPVRQGRHGNPVLLGRGLFTAAMGLKGDEGARRLIGALNADELAEIQASGLGVTFDVDTAEDLAVARRHQGGGP